MIKGHVTLSLLTLFGFLVSVALIRGGYSSVCHLGEHVSCAAVLNSSYSRLFHVPVAVLGACYFLIHAAILVSAALDPSHRFVAWALVLYHAVGAVFCVYLMYAEVRLGQLCPLCTLVHLVTFACLGISWVAARGGPPLRLKPLLWEFRYVAVAALVIVALPLVYYNTPHDALGDSAGAIRLAKCTRKRGVRFYGAAHCGHCIQQKAILGNSFKYVDYVECEDTPQLCSDAGIEGFPTWRSASESREGVLTFRELAIFSGCEIPE